MKKHLFSLLTLALCAVGFVSCSDTTGGGNKPTISVLEVQPSSAIRFGEDGGSKTLTVTTNLDSFALASSQEWCVATKAGDKTFTISADALNGETREAAVVTVSVGEGDIYKEVKINVTQSEGSVTPPGPGGDPDENGFVSRGTIKIPDFITLAFLKGGGASRLTVEIQESVEVPGFFRLVAPYANYEEIWTAYGLNGQAPVISNEAQDLYIYAVNPDEVFFASMDPAFEETGLCPLGLEIQGFGVLSLGSIEAGVLADNMLTIPSKGLGLDITDGSILSAEAGMYYVSIDPITIAMPGADLGTPTISGGLVDYYNGDELAELDPTSFGDCAGNALALYSYEVNESAAVYYQAVMQEGGIPSDMTEDDIIAWLMSAEAKAGPNGVTSRDLMPAYVLPYDLKCFDIAVAVDAAGNPGELIRNGVVTTSKDGCGDINDLMGAPARYNKELKNISVPFASVEAQLKSALVCTSFVKIK